MRVRLYQGLHLSVVLAGMAILVGCEESGNTYVPPPPPPVRVAQPLQQPVTLYFELTGNTAPLNAVDIEARVQGYIQSIDYQDGMTVMKGTKLFGIERDTYQAQLDQAKASLASQQASQVGAKQEYDRQLNLSKQQVTTQTAVDSAKATLDEANASILNAQANLDLATINLGYTEVLAPFDGTVTDHLVDIGALVGVSGPTKLASIVQTDPLYAYFNVSETQVLMIKESLAKQGHTFKQTDLPSIPAEIGLQTEQGYPHKGHLDYVSPQLDASTGTLQVRALFDNKDRAMLPGLFVRVRVPVGHNDKALLVRDDAIGTNQLGSYLLVLGKDDVIEQKQVKTGQREGALRVIDSGLDPADWVVTQGIQQAIPGSKVTPEKIEMNPPAAAAGDAKAKSATQ
ncbi:efflux RND transporter periplasmic adaptor subunit [Rhizobium leguminosarum]|uniref:efflux RND transporter periplasmic adaptor subunit n=1 Tax=Rhizobium leguminosarum TaxID=384 RepID=UPI00048B7EDB|nr:efflux RND transporter periplasmic adaptor subunit [Rhizobium leguminosarum]RWX28635.1 efflux RND transporter periplasmic adaptor subunit [Rhizobium leguminosarum]TBE56474.1 efflux RND transporter periplasmic adaptor subunit [Rhizobium leguminosarum]TBE94071.1 efflux RND transporter periplasmic adaptor subunit [Rhizobium leguminosarum]TBZ31822.1 efflux RND transporter periplasmic adaptor subunit [Rhizobium leguminosarum bv. viciae]TCA05176.1 efflux RND transporter periplasmic adaptor subuni